MQGIPDTLTAQVGIEFTSQDVTGAMSQANARQQAVIDALANAGVDRKDIRTTEVSLQPQYTSQSPAQRRRSAAIAPIMRSKSRSVHPMPHHAYWN
ncbi:hypothetical protein I551_6751 [Mycobacterium ulcerans str. Harvey]|uniref:Uncharacterized protein n=1 Tax=Mycobacterium ulcerans str. Harvey TaxID=1299332 RepID=A0ABP3AAP2_MYCUL|nr:hypothetical protein I551_6751 [Mycobacterium ulcerans str. Harvey]